MAKDAKPMSPALRGVLVSPPADVEPAALARRLIAAAPAHHRAEAECAARAVAEALSEVLAGLRRFDA